MVAVDVDAIFFQATVFLCWGVDVEDFEDLYDACVFDGVHGALAVLNAQIVLQTFAISLVCDFVEVSLAE